MKSDVDLTRDVLARLEFDRELDAKALEVSVRNGVVTLEGTLRSGKERAATELAAKLVPGVKGIVNRIQVEMRESESATDAEIAETVVQAIQWLTTVPAETVAVTVQDGWVTLRGAVESWHQRETLEEVVRHLPPTKGINNLLAVSPQQNLEMTKAA